MECCLLGGRMCRRSPTWARLPMRGPTREGIIQAELRPRPLRAEESLSLRRNLVLLVLVALAPGPALAQAPYAQPAFHSFRADLTGGASTSQALYTPSDTASTRTYWLEGGLIGAVVLGVTSAVVENAVANSLCSDTAGEGCHDYRTLAIVGGTALGFLIGSLIGRGHAKARN